MSKELTVDQKLEIIRESIVNGARVHLYFHDVPSMQAGEEIITELAEKVGTTFSNNETTGVFSLDHNKNDLHTAVFYEQTKEDKKAILRKLLAELEEGEVTA